jgi:hypothetical protein
VAQDNVVVVTWANYHYRDFVMNWVEHLRATGCTAFIVGEHGGVTPRSRGNTVDGQPSEIGAAVQWTGLGPLAALPPLSASWRTASSMSCAAVRGARSRAWRSDKACPREPLQAPRMMATLFQSCCCWLTDSIQCLLSSCTRRRHG